MVQGLSPVASISRGHDLDLAAINRQLEHARPPDILEWAWNEFAPHVAVSSSFQPQSVPLLHLVSQTTPEMPVLFLDTGFHFQETLAFRDQLQREFGLEIVAVKTAMGHRGFRDRHGDLFRQDPDRCCSINKVEPMELALGGQQAWISGIRRDQSPQRADTPIVARLPNGLYKICPLANWTRRDVWDYAHRNRLPEHPLVARGYRSIGCAPCTRPVADDEDERAGRWSGREKTECGLHTVLGTERDRR